MTNSHHPQTMMWLVQSTPPFFATMFAFWQTTVSYLFAAFCFVGFFACPRLLGSKRPTPLLFGLIAVICRFTLFACHTSPPVFITPTILPKYCLDLWFDRSVCWIVDLRETAGQRGFHHQRQQRDQMQQPESHFDQ